MHSQFLLAALLALGSTVALANGPPPALQKAGCMACHGTASKIVGPGYNEVAARYKGQADAEGKLVAKLKAGGQGVWGAIPMPPQTQLKDEDAHRLVKWILSGAKAQ